MRLTGDGNFGPAGLDLAKRGPGDALAAVAVETKVFLDVVASDVSLHFQLADACHRVDKLVGRMVFLTDSLSVADKVELQGVGCPARQSGRFGFDYISIFRLLQEEWGCRVTTWTAGSQWIH